jgi:cytochrome b561
VDVRPDRTDGKNDVYDATSIFLHWLTVILVLLMFVLVIFPGVVKGAISLHKSIGLLLLVIVPLRILWRLVFGRRCDAAANEPLLLRLGAKGAHLALYALLIITPLLGWLYVDSRADEVRAFGLDLPMLVYYDRHLQYALYFWKQVAAYGLLTLIVLHAVAAVVYHGLLRRDAVLQSMLPARYRRPLAAARVPARVPVTISAIAIALVGLAPGAGRAETFDVNRFAADLAASLAKECPMASTSDVAAHEACRKNMGQGAEAHMREGMLLFGGQQPKYFWLRDKKTSVFRGDVFEDLYMSLYMYTGKYRVEDAPDGLKVIGIQAYFRNGLPPGRYPYPFWHSNAKWLAYEKSNELRFRITRAGKVEFAYRADFGSDENRGPYTHVERPPFLGEWMWRDDSGQAQPKMTLFSEFYSEDNPNLDSLDVSYRKMALTFRDANCTVCHQPEGHGRMNKLVLLQTPVHAASHIDSVLHEVRAGKMPVDDYGDPMRIKPSLRQRLLADGGEFKSAIDAADEWERGHNRPKARPASAE